MPKKPAKVSSSQDQKQAKDVAAKVKAIRAAYEMGKKLLEQCADEIGRDSEMSGKTTYASYTVKKLANEYGTNTNAINKCMAFAKTYSESDVDELVALMEEFSYAMGESLIHRLLSVKNKKSRQSLERQAAENQWTRDQLDQVISTKSRKHKRGGRKPKVTNAKERIAKIRNTANAFCNIIEAEQQQDDAGKPTFDHLKLEGKQLDSVKRAYQALKRMLTELEG